MVDRKLYERLVQHFDQGIVGAPISLSLLEILKVLFPGWMNPYVSDVVSAHQLAMRKQWN